MRAILIGPAHPLRGGIASFNESLCRALMKKGIEAEIISFHYQYPAFIFPGKTQFISGPSPEGVPITSMISSVSPISWLKTAKYIRSKQPDIIIAQFWIPLMAPSVGSIIRLAKRKSNMKCIAVMHNAIPHEKRPGDKAFTKYFIDACDGFICLSGTVLDDLSTLTNNTHKQFVPHPVYDIFGEKISKKDARSFLGIKPDEKIVLFFGLIRKYKGLDLLLNAMSDPRLMAKNIKLIVAGEFYEEKQPYMNLVQHLGLSGKVLFTDGFIENEEVKYYFCSSDIIVQPYVTATQSGVTQIAYHFERPMLVTNVGGLAEIVTDGKTGYVTEVNEKSVADALVDFYENNRENEISKNVAAEKHRFSWSNLVDELSLMSSAFQTTGK